MKPIPPEPVVHVVDDDAPFLRSLLFMLEGCGFQTVGHTSAEAFLEAAPVLPPAGGCVLLDIRMPRMSGLELQRRLRQADSSWQLVFMTGHGDIEQAVQAMKHGAIDFLQKPFREQAMIDAVTAAVQASLASRRRRLQQDHARETLAKLTPREREVARLLGLGLSNKEVARELSISDNTVHVHRQRITEKIGSGHAADLARLILRADADGLDTGGPRPD